MDAQCGISRQRVLRMASLNWLTKYRDEAVFGQLLASGHECQNYLLGFSLAPRHEKVTSLRLTNANKSHGRRCRILKNAEDDRNRLPRRRSPDS
jgi:hypothetical protein